MFVVQDSIGSGAKEHPNTLRSLVQQQVPAGPPACQGKEVLQPKSIENQKPEVQPHTAEKQNQTWTLRFNDSKSKRGHGVGLEMISPNGETYLAAHRLQFHCTNNVAEYESLVHCFLLAIQTRARVLHCFGDSEVVVGQIRKLYTCHDKKLNYYRNRVWGLIESFDVFNIKTI